jgi:cysteine-S-conjugate beta-lyase
MEAESILRHQDQQWTNLAAAQAAAANIRWSSLRRRADAPEPIGLCIADSDLETPSFIIDALADRLKHRYFGYTHLRTDLRELVASWYKSRYNWILDEEAVVFFPFGIKTALKLALRAWAPPAKPVVFLTPGYRGIRKVAQLAGFGVVEVPLAELGACRYSLDRARLSKVIDEARAGTLVFCSPHNPLGLVWHLADLEWVAQLAADRRLLVISDEVHSGLTHPGVRHYPWGSVDGNNRWIVLDSAGKSFNVSGIAASWGVAGDVSVARALRNALENEGFHEGSLLGDIVIASALRDGGRWLPCRAHAIRDRIQFAGDVLDSLMPGVPRTAPRAGFLLWLDASPLVGRSDEPVAKLIYERTGVRTLDGRRFGEGYQAFCRLNVATDWQILQSALARLAALARGEYEDDRR